MLKMAILIYISAPAYFLNSYIFFKIQPYSYLDVSLQLAGMRAEKAYNKNLRAKLSVCQHAE